MVGGKALVWNIGIFIGTRIHTHRVQLMITLYSSITAGVKSSYVNIPSRGVRDTNLASIPNFLSP